MASGLAHPFRRIESDFASSSGDAEILMRVSQVLGTRQGTLPFRPDFGSELHRLRHKKNAIVLRETARVFVDDALRKWVPEAKLISVDILPSKANEIILKIITQIGDKQQSLTQRI